METRVLILKDEAEYKKARTRTFYDKHIVAYGTRNGLFILRKNRFTGIQGVVTAQQLTELIGA